MWLLEEGCRHRVCVGEGWGAGGGPRSRNPTGTPACPDTDPQRWAADSPPLPPRRPPSCRHSSGAAVTQRSFPGAERGQHFVYICTFNNCFLKMRKYAHPCVTIKKQAVQKGSRLPVSLILKFPPHPRQYSNHPGHYPDGGLTMCRAHGGVAPPASRGNLPALQGGVRPLPV